MGYLGLVGNIVFIFIFAIGRRPLPNGLFRISWKQLSGPQNKPRTPFLMGYLGLVGNDGLVTRIKSINEYPS